MRKSVAHLCAVTVSLLLVLCLGTQTLPAQDSPASRAKLARAHFKNGDETLRAFASVCASVRDSVVKLDVNGNTVALAAVIDENGMAVTKGSEIKAGKLTCWIASGQEVDAKLISKDEENDLALVKVDAKGLKPIQWATGETFVGQWVVTPGTTEMPQAIGIISVPTRRIPPPRAFIGVQLQKEVPPRKSKESCPGLAQRKPG